jgi:hypothetical protein
MPPLINPASDPLTPAFGLDLAELAPPMGGVPPVIPTIDRVLLADWIAKSTEDAYPLVSSVAQALRWSDERIAYAIDAGVKAGTLERWANGPSGPAITLSALEVKLRGLKVWPVKGGEFAFGWRPINTADRQPRCSIRVGKRHKQITEADLEPSDERLNGQPRSMGAGKPGLAKFSRPTATEEYIDTIEYMKAHPRELGKPAGMRVLEKKASRGVVFTEPNAAWPDPARHRYPEPGQPPREPGPADPCPVCHGGESPDDETDANYCLYCDRSGADTIIPGTEPFPLDQPPRRGPDKGPRKKKAGKKS